MDKIYIEEICVGENCAGYCNLLSMEALYEEIIRSIYSEEEERDLWIKDERNLFGEFTYYINDYFPVIITYAKDFNSPLNEITIYHSPDYKTNILTCIKELYN
jgi:hypothetical protein